MVTCEENGESVLTAFHCWFSLARVHARIHASRPVSSNIAVVTIKDMQVLIRGTCSNGPIT